MIGDIIPKAEGTTSFSSLRTLLARLPAALNADQKGSKSEGLEERSKAHHRGGSSEDTEETVTDLTKYAPSVETREFLWDVLSWRDDLVREILSAIESIPGLGELIEQIMDAVNECMLYADGIRIKSTYYLYQICRRIYAPCTCADSKSNGCFKGLTH